ncbi:restriction endonuclease subunit S [Streptococcus hyointestinalis]|uniref:restriction endonuclease subunit S n=1 Tax=Streptococcus hyointestinalis TaxID=1337 RepID=UPI003F9C4165
MKTNSVPKIRFKGFTDDWEQRKAGEIFKSVSDKGYTDLPVLSASQELGMILRDEIGIDIKYDESSIKNYKRVKPGQFVIHLRSFQGGFAWSDIEGITSPAYTILDYQEPEEHCSKFWKIVLTSPMFITRLETVTYGIRDGRSISFTDFSTLNLNVPSIAEQQKIGEYFSKLDNLITLHQRKCDQTKELKKFMLQKMFPKKGEKNPEIRFSGFTDDWEQRKLGELVTFSKGSGYSKGDLLKEGTPIILYGRLYTKYETVISNVDTFVEPKGKSVFSKGGEVIVPGSGETAEDISIASVVEESGVLLGGDLNIITPPKEINSAFLAISISNGKPHKDMAKMAQGKSVVHLHNSDLAKIDFPFPIYEEQCRISNQFAELDNLITLHHRS